MGEPGLEPPAPDPLSEMTSPRANETMIAPAIGSGLRMDVNSLVLWRLRTLAGWGVPFSRYAAGPFKMVLRRGIRQRKAVRGSGPC